MSTTNTAYDNHENGIGVYQSHDVNLTLKHGLQQHLANGILLDQVTHSNVTGNNASYNGLSGINLTKLELEQRPGQRCEPQHGERNRPRQWFVQQHGVQQHRPVERPGRDPAY